MLRSIRNAQAARRKISCYDSIKSSSTVRRRRSPDGGASRAAVTRSSRLWCVSVQDANRRRLSSRGHHRARLHQSDCQLGGCAGTPPEEARQPPLNRMARRLIVRPLAEADLENAARMMTAGRKRRTDGPPSHGCVVCCGVAVFSSSVVSAGAGLQFFRAVNLAQIAVECADRPMTGLSGDFEKEAISKATVI